MQEVEPELGQFPLLNMPHIDIMVGSVVELSSDAALQCPPMLPGMVMEVVDEAATMPASIGAILEAVSSDPAESSVDTSTEVDSSELSESTALSYTAIVETNVDRESAGISRPESPHEEASQCEGRPSPATSNSKRAVAILEGDPLDGCGVVLERPAGDAALCDA